MGGLTRGRLTASTRGPQDPSGCDRKAEGRAVRCRPPWDNKVRSETEGASLTGMSVVPGFCNGFHGALRPGYTQA